MRLYVKMLDEKILRRLLLGESPKEVAKHFHIQRHTVFDAVRRQGYRNVTHFLETA